MQYKPCLLYLFLDSLVFLGLFFLSNGQLSVSAFQEKMFNNRTNKMLAKWEDTTQCTVSGVFVDENFWYRENSRHILWCVKIQSTTNGQSYTSNINQWDKSDKKRIYVFLLFHNQVKITISD